MQKVAIVTDSIACLPKEIVEEYAIRIMPINFYAGGKIYKDWVDVTPSEAYQLFLQDPDSFKTSAVSPGDCLESYRDASKQARNILCITISAKLSTVYNVAQAAKQQIKAELPQVSVEVVDSQTAAAAEGFVVLAAARAVAEGKDLAEVVKAAEEIRERVRLIILLDTIRHVYRSGRIPKVASQIGSMLNIKPILTISSGAVHFKGAVRNKENGIDQLLKMLVDNVGRNRVHVAVTHAYAESEAEKLKERIASEFNCAELWLSEFSPIMGYACGSGTVGFAFYAEP